MGRAFRVLLVNMSFCQLYWPSIGLSLLAAGLERRNLNCAVRYLNLDLLSVLGHADHDRILTSSQSVLRST